MADLKSKSSQNSLSSRKPFEPISHVWEIPAALYECRQLAIDGKNLALVALLESIIRVAGVDSHTWSNLPQSASPEMAATIGE
jgi:hypothetical protein